MKAKDEEPSMEDRRMWRSMMLIFVIIMILTTSVQALTESRLLRLVFAPALVILAMLTAALQIRYTLKFGDRRIVQTNRTVANYQRDIVYGSEFQVLVMLDELAEP